MPWCFYLTSSFRLLSGAIHSVKANYRKSIIRFVLGIIRSGAAQRAEDVAKDVDIYQAIKWLLSAWESVSAESLRKYWIKTGILADSLAAEVKALNNDKMELDADDADPIASLAAELRVDVPDLDADLSVQLASQLLIDEDEDLPEQLREDTIEELAGDLQDLDEKQEDKIGDSEIGEPDPVADTKPVTFAEAVAALDTVIQFLTEKDAPRDAFTATRTVSKQLETFAPIKRQITLQGLFSLRSSAPQAASSSAPAASSSSSSVGSLSAPMVIE